MKTIDRSKALILLTIVVMASILSGITLTTVMADTGEENTSELTSLVAVTEDENTDDSAEFMPWRMMMRKCEGPQGGFRGGPLGRGGFGYVEVSEEFEENVIAIAEGDEDVQALLDEGYNITAMRPIIKTVVDGEGNVVTKATDAIVMLSKDDETGRASVWVNLEMTKVTEIVIVTRTVIEKP